MTVLVSLCLLHPACVSSLRSARGAAPPTRDPAGFDRRNVVVVFGIWAVCIYGVRLFHSDFRITNAFDASVALPMVFWSIRAPVTNRVVGRMGLGAVLACCRCWVRHCLATMHWFMHLNEVESRKDIAEG
jgi:hypothetical protein